MRSILWLVPIDDFFIYSLYHRREWIHGEEKDLALLLTKGSYACPKDFLVKGPVPTSVQKQFPDVTFHRFPLSERKWVVKEWIKTKKS